MNFTENKGLLFVSRDKMAALNVEVCKSVMLEVSVLLASGLTPLAGQSGGPYHEVRN